LVAARDLVHLTSLVQPLDAVLADRLQGPVPGWLAPLDDEQAVLGQPGQPVGDLRAFLASSRDGAGRVEVEPRGEHRDAAQQRAISGREQLVAPADRRAPRATASGYPPR